MSCLTVRDYAESDDITVEHVTKKRLKSLLETPGVSNQQVYSYIARMVVAHYRKHYSEDIEEIARLTTRTEVPSDFLMGYEFEFVSSASRAALAEIFTFVLGAIYCNDLGDVKFNVSAVDGYHHIHRTAMRWIFETDGSVRPTDDYPFVVELVSPPMTADACFSFLPLIFSFISVIGSTNKSCGLHFTVGHKALKTPRSMDLLAFFTEFSQDKTLTAFDRKGNSYCEPVQLESSFFTSVTSTDYAACKSAAFPVLDTNKYRSINFGKLSSGLIELRAMGGANYHKRYAEVYDTSVAFLSAVQLSVRKSYKTRSHSYRAIVRELKSSSTTQEPAHVPDVLSDTCPLPTVLALDFISGNQDPDIAVSVDSFDVKETRPALVVLSRRSCFVCKFYYLGTSVFLRAYINAQGNLVFVVSNPNATFSWLTYYKLSHFLQDHLPSIFRCHCYVAMSESSIYQLMSRLRRMITKPSSTYYHMLTHNDNYVVSGSYSLPVGNMHTRYSAQARKSVEHLLASDSSVVYDSAESFHHFVDLYKSIKANTTFIDLLREFLSVVSCKLAEGVPVIDLLRETYVLGSTLLNSWDKVSMTETKDMLSAALWNRDALGPSPVAPALLMVLLQHSNNSFYRCSDFLERCPPPNDRFVLNGLAQLWREQALLSSACGRSLPVSDDILCILSLTKKIIPGPMLLSTLEEISQYPSTASNGVPAPGSGNKMALLIHIYEHVPLTSTTRKFYLELLVNSGSLQFRCDNSLARLRSNADFIQDYTDLFESFLVTGDLRTLRILKIIKETTCDRPPSFDCFWEASKYISCGLSSLHSLIRAVFFSTKHISWGPVRFGYTLLSHCSIYTDKKFLAACTSHFSSNRRSALMSLLISRPCYYKSTKIPASRIQALLDLVR